ncbi:hypothetical protein PM082_019997 [Marasmius tenuissimus]|nr:hypothetical protein PM082_019997 [Marasmius tenuissimus]
MSGKRKIKREGDDDATKRPAKRVKRKGSLTPMHDMPIETVYEIFSQCEPYDLLRLARTSRKLREMLMTRSSSWVWKRARQNLGVPDPTPEMSEPKLAHLLFDKHCHICGCNVQQGLLFPVAMRCCRTCEKENFVFLEDTVSLPGSLLDTLPHYKIFNEFPSAFSDDSDSDSDFDSDLMPMFRYVSYRFLLPEAEDIIKEYQLLPESEAKLWLAERVKIYERDKNLIESWKKWHEGYGKKLVEDTRLARVKRCQDIQNRMKELGWSHKVLDDCRFRGHKLVCQSKPLTERIWNNIKDKLEEVAQDIKDEPINPHPFAF